jgi:hypothetical protein
MSHKANYWLANLDPNAVKSGAFRVLFHLCDHHNDEKRPEMACYPSQGTLRAKTGLSNGALNNALNQMEQDGLLRRKRSAIPGESTPRTYYILGCDFDLIQEQTPENGVSPNSSLLETAQKLTPVSEGANSSFEGGKLQPTGEEPVRTGKESEKPPFIPPANSQSQLTLPTSGETGEPPEEKPPAPKQKRATSISEDWAPSEKNIQDAHARNFTDEEISHEADRFRDYHLAKGTTFKNWDAGWRTWLGNARKFASRRMAQSPRSGGYGQGGSLASIAAQRRAAGQV